MGSREPAQCDLVCTVPSMIHSLVNHKYFRSTFDAPVSITNKRGIVVFAKNDLMFTSEAGGLGKHDDHCRELT